MEYSKDIVQVFDLVPSNVGWHLFQEPEADEGEGDQQAQQ
jgi:hypothetical protein